MPEPTYPTLSPDAAELTSLKKTIEGAFSKKNWNYVKTIATDILIKKGFHDADVLEKFLTACLESSLGTDGVRGTVISRVQGAIGSIFDFRKSIEGLPGQVKQTDYMERFFVGIQSNAMLAPIYLSRVADWIYTHRAVYSAGSLTKTLAVYFSRQDAQKEDLQKAELLYGPETKEGRDVSARISMKRDIDPDGSLKERDALGRVEQEQASRKGMTKEQLEKRRDDLVGRYNQNSNDLNVVKELAGVYEELEDWENAGTFYQWAYGLSKETDTTLKDKADEMKIKQLEKQLSITIAGIKMAGQDVDGQTEVKALEDQIWSSRITCAQKRVIRNPADYEGHFNLGKALWEDFQRKNEKDITSSLLLTAISHIQEGLKYAKQENEIHLLLAEIFSFQGLHRIALGHIEEVLKSIQEDMNDLKQKALYLKGTIHEKSGEKQKAAECFEDIYAYDAGFRDVANKVLKEST